MPANFYQYTPLLPDEIRCVRIVDSRDDDGDITVEIKRHSSASSYTKYDTLSYTWGPEEPQHTINVANGQGTLRIRDNCWRFFKHWRKVAPDLNAWIWIDAICINQTDNNEKAEQVSRMGDIFLRARRVLVWLGQVSESTALSDLFDKHSAVLKPHPAHWDHSTKDYKAYDESLAGFYESCFPLHTRRWLADRSDPAVINLQQILDSEYWSRLWIIQEVALAKTHCFILGNALYSAHDMDTVYSTVFIMSDIFKSLTSRSRSLGGSYMIGILKLMRSHFHIRTWDEAHHRLPSRVTPSKPVTRKSTILILDMIDQFQDHQCLDFRDRIYGLLSLTKRGSAFKVDYEASPEDLLVGLLTNVLLEQEEDHLYLLHKLIHAHNAMRGCQFYWSITSSLNNKTDGDPSIPIDSVLLSTKFDILFTIEDIYKQTVDSPTWSRLQVMDFLRRSNQEFWKVPGLDFTLRTPLSELAVEDLAPRQMWLINIGQYRKHAYIIVNNNHKATHLLFCKPPCSCYTIFGDVPDPTEWENGIFLEEGDEKLGVLLLKHLDYSRVGVISRALVDQPSSRVHPVGQGFSCSLSAGELLEFSHALRQCQLY